MTYKEAVRTLWRHDDKASLAVANQVAVDGTSPNKYTSDEVLREIVRYGTLAPSSHNTQCWKFLISPSSSKITVCPDFARRCPVVDPDDHHLFASLGCAIENMVVAAKALGLDSDVDSNSPCEGIDVYFKPGKAETTPLFEAIPERQCTRLEYDGNSLSDEEIAALKRAGTGSGVQVHFLTEPASINTALEYIIEGNTNQIDNPRWMKELKNWIRFGESDALTTGDGLYGKCMGSPSVPKWIGGFVFDRVVRSEPENAKIRRHVASSAGIAVFVSDKDDMVHWVESGRCYERFALQATSMGIRNAHLNMPVEEAGVRPRFAKALGLKDGARPDLVVRFGKGPKMPPSLRRPIESVLEYDN